MLKSSSLLVVLAVAVPSLLASLPSLAAEPPTMVVMSLEVGKGIDKGTAKLLNDLILAEFQKTGRFKVFGQHDIVAMMDLQQAQVQTKGCADDACLAEIGGALGASYLVTPSVGKVGQKFLLNMKLLDVQRANAVGRSSRIMEGKEEFLLTEIAKAVAEVIGEVGAEAKVSETKDAESPADEPAPSASASVNASSNADTTETNTASAEAAPPETATTSSPAADAKATLTASGQKDAGPGGVYYAAWTMSAIGAAAAIGAAVTGGLAAADRTSMDDEYTGSQKFEDLRDTAETKAMVCNILLGARAPQ